MPYIIQSILILLGPAFFAGSIYMVLGRLIQVLEGEDYSLIRVKWLTKLFLLGDILSIFGQGGGESTNESHIPHQISYPTTENTS
jgi:hypothetical protein